LSVVSGDTETCRDMQETQENTWKYKGIPENIEDAGFEKRIK
jgi:hypothetical protein